MACEPKAELEHTAAVKHSAGQQPAQAEPPRRGGPLISPDRPSYKWWLAGTMMFCAFLVVVNNTTVNIILPPLMTAFGLNLDQAQWVMTAYMIANAVLIPTVGWLGSWLGNRNLFLLGLLIFVGSSALCGLAWSGSTLILFRVLQGIGAGPITPMVMVFMTSAFPERQRGFAMGLYGMASAFGPAVGPVLGGYVTEFLNWRMVFYMNVVPGLLCILLVLCVIPNTRDSARRSLDVAGLLTLVVFIVSLLIALTQGQRHGWDSPYIQRLFITAGVSFVVFVSLELWQKEPLVELRLYTNLAFAGVSLATLVTAMTFWGTGFLQTILLQRLLHYTPAQAGVIVIPGALVLAGMMLVSGRLADKVDRRYIVWGGLGLFALASYWFSFLTLERSTGWIVWMIIARYAAIPFIFTPMNAASLMLLPPDKVRMGSGLINLLQQGIGGSVGLALMTTMLQRRTSAHTLLLDQQQAFSALSWREVLTPVQDLVTRVGDVGAMIDIKAFALVHRHLLQQATVAAYQDCF
ncbi:MAG: DHA2 family efflux MFS transporter permease subunit, partial [Candidatus Tectomicrobia bacterium]